MDNEKEKEPLDPEQKKWDKAGPDQATGRTGGAGGESYTEGSSEEQERSSGEERMRAGTKERVTRGEQRISGSNTAGTPHKKEEDPEMEGGTPRQGPTTGGMGAAGGGHDTDETDVWGDKDRT